MLRRVAVGGATGFLGAYLCAWFASEGYEVLAFARGRDDAEARRRVREILDGIPDFGPIALDRVRVFAYDLAGGELPAEAARELRGVPFVNTIASLKHSEQHRAEIMDTNVEGTRRLLDALTAAGVSRLCHVSTAYVCGSAAGEVAERPIDVAGTAFNNLYEQSKATAEALLLAQSAIPVDIVRPSIIIGSSPTGWARNFTGYYGLYAVVRAAAHEVSQAFGGRRLAYLPLGLPGDPRACSDVVTVDYVADCIGRLVQCAATAPAGHDIMHVVSGAPRPTAYFLGAVESHLGLGGVEFVTPDRLTDGGTLERWCSARLRFNTSYTVRDYRFSDDRLRARLGAAAPSPSAVGPDVLWRVNDFFGACLEADAPVAPRDAERAAALASQFADRPGFLQKNGIEIDPRSTPAAAVAARVGQHIAP
ncbi:MAG: SDR family oxidoreductase [Candidatus Wallbacteria bacterium]|nr:SDR family oxidoreductase [Candidatus Wallbacteria bacterium]